MRDDFKLGELPNVVERLAPQNMNDADENDTKHATCLRDLSLLRKLVFRQITPVCSNFLLGNLGTRGPTW